MAEDQDNTEATEEEEIISVFTGVAPKNLDGFLEVQAKVPNPDGPAQAASGYYNFGSDLEACRQLFGDEVVFTNARAQMKIRLQALMRTYIKKGQDIEKLLAEWKPGVQMERIPVDPLQAAENKFDTLTVEEQKAFLDKLLAKQSGK